MLEVQIRPYEKTDEEFLYQSFLKSHKESGFGKSISHDLYYRGMRQRINRLLANPQVYVLVACDSQVPEMIFGYAIFEGSNVLHYIYVKRNYRLQGIAKRLINFALDELEPTIYTHRPNEIWAERKLKEDPQLLTYFYDPFILESSETAHG